MVMNVGDYLCIIYVRDRTTKEKKFTRNAVYKSLMEKRRRENSTYRMTPPGSARLETGSGRHRLCLSLFLRCREISPCQFCTTLYIPEVRDAHALEKQYVVEQAARDLE
jgi:hypothetical protein